MQQPGSESSSSALGAVVSPHGRELGVGLGHECLQLFLKQLIRSLGCSRLHRRTLGTLLCLGLILETAALPAGCPIAAEIIGSGAIVFALGLGLQSLDGQIDLAIVRTNDHDLYVLSLCQMLADVTDIGIRHLRNMYHTGLVLRQGYKRTEIGDGLHFTFQYGSNG